MLKTLKALFSGAKTNGSDGDTAPSGESVEYKQFSIQATPIKEGSQYRTAGTITLQADGDNEARSSTFIRADNHASLDAANEHAINKGKQIIDERGEALLHSDHC